MTERRVRRGPRGWWARTALFSALGLSALGCAGRTAEPGEHAAQGTPSDSSTPNVQPPPPARAGAAPLGAAPDPLGPPRIVPELPDVHELDRDGDRLDDALEAEIRGLERSAATPGAAWASAKLKEPLRVVVSFKQPVTREVLAAFVAHGGTVGKIHRDVGYGFSGTLPRERASEIAAALGGSLLLVSGGHPLVHHLDEATRTGRVRPIWAGGFAAGQSFSGSATINIGIVDSGVSGTHTDLTGRQEYWEDFTSDGDGSAVDYDSHGTHVAGIALGSGAAFGTGPGTLLFTDSGDLSTVASGSFLPSTLHLPATSLTFSGTATFLGGSGSTQLFAVDATDGGNGWAYTGGTFGTGAPPLSFSLTFTPSTSQHYSAALTAPAGRYAVKNSVTNFPAVGDGFPALRGVASGSRWGGFKVFRNDGSGASVDLLDAIQGVVDQAVTHHIKVVNMSLGILGSGQTDTVLRSYVNALVQNGVVVVVSAGNEGPSGIISDPGRARLALTVGAASDQNRVTEYSSIGFGSPTASEGTKPDVLAPGGSAYRSMIMAPDSNDSDAESTTFADQRADDYALKQGTSMAAPFVAGSAALVIQALESTGVTWTYADESQPLFVKMLLSASATETAGSREGGGGNDPTLGRTARDLVEGWGIVNPDAAAESLVTTLGTGFSGTTSGTVSDRRAWGRKVALTSGGALHLTLDVPSTADFDLYVYDATPLNAGTASAEGVPNRLASSTSAGLGVDEAVSYTAPSAGTRYVFVKRVSGSGAFTLTVSGVCGDGVLDAGEACDDGNTSNSDCCSTACAAINQGGACNDGNGCTRTDTCQSGSCVGGNPVVCTASDQCHTAGTCNPGNGTCSNPQAGNGTPCNDSNACTQTDSCQSGSCVGGNPVVCTASDQCHTAGACNPSNGTCSNPQAGNGTPCNDSNACTLTDSCQSGSCVGNPVVCTASDQCHTAGACNPSNGTCSNPQAGNGTPCNDGNACTLTDTCQSGSCAGQNGVVCTASDQCHQAGVCDGATGACSNPPVADGNPCDDGNACTTVDHCAAGVCTSSSPVVCSALDECHVPGVCSSSTGVCTNPARSDGSTCSGGECHAGSCVPNAQGGAGQGGDAGSASGGGGTAGRAGRGGSGGTSGGSGATSGGSGATSGGPAGTSGGSGRGGGASGGSTAQGGRSNADGGSSTNGGSGAMSMGAQSAGGAAGAAGATNEGGTLSFAGSSGRAAGGATGGETVSNAGEAGENDGSVRIPPSTTNSKGCGCAVPRNEPSSHYAALLLLGFSIALTRRRKLI